MLHIPASIHCPPVDHPLRPAGPTVVPYAAVLQQVRASHNLQEVLADGSHCEEEEPFAWLNQGNNSATTGRIAEASKQTAAAHYFMYFRIRVADYRSITNSLAQLSKSESLYSDDKLNKWTFGYRFRLFKNAPLKAAMRAFACRLGIESDQSIVFCRDGFYGDGLVGSLTSLSGIPHERLLGDTTVSSSGLSNGSSIFVSRSTHNEREAAAAVLRVIDEDVQDEDNEGDSGEGPPSPATASATPENSAD